MIPPRQSADKSRPAMSFTIAIDGPAASGKGTIARALAARFGFHHLDTGLLYRATGARGGDPVQAARSLTADDLARPDLRSAEAGQAGECRAPAEAEAGERGEIRIGHVELLWCGRRKGCIRPPVQRRIDGGRALTSSS